MIIKGTEVFISQKTGKKYMKSTWDRFGPENTFIIEEVIEPTLEVGDWIKYPLGDKPSLHEVKSVCDAQTYIGFYIYEIRKANGEVWVKEDGEWKKK